VKAISVTYARETQTPASSSKTALVYSIGVHGCSPRGLGLPPGGVRAGTRKPVPGTSAASPLHRLAEPFEQATPIPGHDGPPRIVFDTFQG
jgi:hypothetical protein